jgi:hypothetical protein
MGFWVTTCKVLCGNKYDNNAFHSLVVTSCGICLWKKGHKAPRYLVGLRLERIAGIMKRRHPGTGDATYSYKDGHEGLGYMTAGA